MRPLDRLREAADDLAYTASRWPAFAQSLRDLAADGYPRVASGREKVPGGARSLVKDPDTGEWISVDLTATEAAVTARQRYSDKWAEAEGLIIEAQGIAARLADLMNSVGGEQPQPAIRCIGGMGMQGADEWGDTECVRNAVTRDHLCDPCDQRWYRWRRRNSITPSQVG